MKPNVDLTLNREFRFNPTITPKKSFLGVLESLSSGKHEKSFRGMFSWVPETYQWIENGVKKDFFNYENPCSRKDFEDFIKGLTLVATGSKFMRSHKLDVRGTEIGEICYECGERIRIPWKGCSRCQQYLNSSGQQKVKCHNQLGTPTIVG